jgi:cell shape-determining protein MreC
MPRCSSEDLRSLSKNSLHDAKLNRLSRSSNLRRQIKELREQLMDVRSELHEIEVLLAENRHPLDFPAPTIQSEVKVLSEVELDRQDRINLPALDKKTA